MFGRQSSGSRSRAARSFRQWLHLQQRSNTRETHIILHGSYVFHLSWQSLTALFLYSTCLVGTDGIKRHLSYLFPDEGNNFVLFSLRDLHDVIVLCHQMQLHRRDSKIHLRLILGRPCYEDKTGCGGANQIDCERLGDEWQYQTRWQFSWFVF